MTINKAFLILVLIGGSILNSREKSYGQVSLWAKAGINSSWTSLEWYNNRLLSDDGQIEFSTPLNVGYNVGVNIDIPLGKVLSIRPEIEYREFNIYRNIERTGTDPIYGAYYNSRSRSEARRYISIPINIITHLKYGNNEVQLFGGIYFSKGLDGGRYDDIVFSSTSPDDEKVKRARGTLKADIVPLPFATHRGYYYPFDFGFNIGLGYEVGRFLISTQITIGMVNTQPFFQDWDGNKVDYSRSRHITKNRSLLLSLAFRIVKTIDK